MVIFLTTSTTVDQAVEGSAGSRWRRRDRPPLPSSRQEPSLRRWLACGLRQRNPGFVRALGSLGRQSNSFVLTEDCVLRNTKHQRPPLCVELFVPLPWGRLSGLL